MPSGSRCRTRRAGLRNASGARIRANSFAPRTPRRRPGRPSARCWSSARGSMCAATTWRTWAAGCTPWSPPSCSIRLPRPTPSRAPRRSSPAGTPTSASTPPTPWPRQDGFTPSCRSVFAPAAIEVEVPILHRLADGRVVRGFVDLLVETAAGWLIIDHKSSPQPKSTWRRDALGYAGQLAAYRDALLAAAPEDDRQDGDTILQGVQVETDHRRDRHRASSVLRIHR